MARNGDMMAQTIAVAPALLDPPAEAMPELRHVRACAGPLLDLACKIFGTQNAAVSLVDRTDLYILDGRGNACAGAVIEGAWTHSAFCCWSMVSSLPSVLTVEDSRLDARSAESPLCPPPIRCKEPCCCQIAQPCAGV